VTEENILVKLEDITGVAYRESHSSGFIVCTPYKILSG
jgi:hypothetical protein